ncbi:MAG: hypothetical protein EHM61_20760 [Acidobacteria bacterium]|nr:MAG: hypothetical protein EHM61_20760 [Acidobacteriota bacterium]
MRWASFFIWSIVGFLSGILGCSVGGLVGSFWPQTVLAAAASAAVFGLLIRQWRLAIIAGAVAAAITAAAFPLGALTVTPLLAWPVAGLGIGLVAFFVLRTSGAKVVVLLLTPVLAGIGFGGGAALLAFIGMMLNDSELVAHFMLGGAAGFGFLVLGGLRVVTWRGTK